MYRIIGGDGREYGPVSANQIEQWIAQKRANGATRIKAEGSDMWTTVSGLPEFAEKLNALESAPPLSAQTAPSHGRAEASPSSAPTAPVFTATAEDARARADQPFRFGVFDILGQGWDIIVSRFWLVVGGVVISALVNTAAGFIPILGTLATVLLTQVFYAGVYWLILRVARREAAEIGDIFAGFTREFGKLVGLSLVTFVCYCTLAMVALGPLVWMLIQSGVLKGTEPDPIQFVGPVLAMPVLMIPLVYLAVSWVFAPILIIDRGLGVWEALELSRRVVAQRWFRMFFLFLCFIPLAIAGLFCFIVGAFVSSALMYAAVIAAYRTAFPESLPRTDPEPTGAGTEGASVE